MRSGSPLPLLLADLIDDRRKRLADRDSRFQAVATVGPPLSSEIALGLAVPDAAP